MAPRETDQPSISNSDAKGKGKATSSSSLPPQQQHRQHDDSASSSGGATGLLRSVAQSAQASVTPQALSSILQSGGKAGAASAPLASISGQGLDDLRRAAASNAASAGTAASATYSSSQPSLRTTANDDARITSNDAYSHFSGQDGLSSRFNDAMQLSSTSSTPPQREAYVGAFQSAADLDRPMHEYVRTALAASSQDDDEGVLQSVWDDISKSSDGVSFPDAVQDPAYHDAWARTVPAPMFPPATVSAQREARFAPSISEAGMADSSDFMSALQAEEQADMRASGLQSVVPSHALTQSWRPPSPSQPPTLTEEQYALHSKLAEEQDGDEAQRAEERIRPPDDDRAARSGVYAATPEDALRAVWDGAGEGQRASEYVREERELRSSDGAEVVRRLRRLLSRGSYVDDVYGLPPALEATMRQAEEPESDANREMRAKAIARLNALYKHLGDDGTDSSSLVRDWKT